MQQLTQLVDSSIHLFLLKSSILYPERWNIPSKHSAGSLYPFQNNTILKVMYRYVFNGPTPSSLCLYSFFSNTNFTEKIVDISGIRTGIVGGEDEHADHLTNTTALNRFVHNGRLIITKILRNLQNGL